VGRRRFDVDGWLAQYATNFDLTRVDDFRIGCQRRSALWQRPMFSLRRRPVSFVASDELGPAHTHERSIPAIPGFRSVITRFGNEITCFDRNR
jgi:hypothetical protein